MLKLWRCTKSSCVVGSTSGLGVVFQRDVRGLSAFLDCDANYLSTVICQGSAVKTKYEEICDACRWDP